MFAVAVPEENGVVHGDSELKDGGEGFGDIGDFAKDDIGAEVDKNHNANAAEEDDRGKPVIKKDEHNGEGERDGNGDVDDLLAIADFFKVDYEGGHTGNVKMAVHETTNFGNSG